MKSIIMSEQIFMDKQKQKGKSVKIYKEMNCIPENSTDLEHIIAFVVI